MNTKPILESEYEALRISALPSRPTASSAFGGRGYTASQLKAAFDRLPLLIIARFNALLADIESAASGSLIDTLPTGLESNHTLKRFFEDITSGTLATYLKVDGRSLSAALSEIEAVAERLKHIAEDVESGALATYLSVGEKSLSEALSETKAELEALSRFLEDVESGALATYLSVGEKSLSEALSETKAELEALSRFLEDVESGALATYLSVGEKSLSEALADTEAALEDVNRRLEEGDTEDTEFTFDCGHPSDRNTEE